MRKPNLAFLKANLGTILSITASFGVIGTTISAIHATPKAEMMIREKERHDRKTMTTSQKIFTSWRCYIPTIIFGTATIGCILGGNALHLKREASLISAYAFLEKRIKENELSLEEAEVMDSFDIKSFTETEAISFYFEYYDKIFERSMLEVMDAEMRLNRRLNYNGHVFVNDFLELLCLPKNGLGDVLGWDFQTTWIEFEHGITDVDGMDCYTITFRNHPTTELLIPPFYN